MTTPNRFIRFYPDGRVSYSQRLTVWARCSMHLGKFPFDSQKCPLEIGSFGYHAGDVQYEWAGQAIEFGKFEMAEMALKEFHHGVDTGLTNRKLANGFRNDSIAFLTLDFERESGFFLLGIYFPLTLVVVCSWVGLQIYYSYQPFPTNFIAFNQAAFLKAVEKYTSQNLHSEFALFVFSIVSSFFHFLQVAFWIVKTDTPSRTSLGIITILSVTKIGFGGKTKPKVIRMMGMRKTVMMTMMLRMMVITNQSEGGLFHRFGHLQHHLLRFHLCRTLRVCSHQLHWDVCSEVCLYHLHSDHHWLLYQVSS